MRPRKKVTKIDANSLHPEFPSHLKPQTTTRTVGRLVRPSTPYTTTHSPIDNSTARRVVGRGVKTPEFVTHESVVNDLTPTSFCGRFRFSLASCVWSRAETGRRCLEWQVRPLSLQGTPGQDSHTPLFPTVPGLPGSPVVPTHGQMVRDVYTLKHPRRILDTLRPR